MKDAHHGVRREKGPGREQIADHAEQQIGKGLTSPEESRNSVGRTGTTDDGLQRGAQALPARQGLALLGIKPLEVSLCEAAITLCKC